MLQTSLLCDSGQIVLPRFILASPCVTRWVLLISLAGGSTRCLPLGFVKSFDNAAFERLTVLLQWALDDWTCLTALCGAKKWVGPCIIVTKGRQFLRQLLKLNSIYHFNARIYFNLDIIQGTTTSKIRVEAESGSHTGTFLVLPQSQQWALDLESLWCRESYTMLNSIFSSSQVGWNSLRYKHCLVRELSGWQFQTAYPHSYFSSTSKQA